MTISVKVSVNGNYKCPVTFRQGDREEKHLVSGFGLNGPNELYIPVYHGPDQMTVQIGPEEPDNGENASA